jgi:hypothetical protein
MKRRIPGLNIYMKSRIPGLNIGFIWRPGDPAANGKKTSIFKMNYIYRAV